MSPSSREMGCRRRSTSPGEEVAFKVDKLKEKKKTPMQEFEISNH